MAQDFSGSIAEIVERDYRTGEVFKKYHMNFCCGGQISLIDSCTQRNIDYQELIDELVWATRTIVVPNNLSFEDWDLNFLIDYILNIHHAYIFQTIPILRQELSTFAVGHERKLPEINNVAETFDKLSSLLLIHSKHEEEIIFPYIRQMADAYKRKEVYGSLFVRTLRKPLNNIHSEHIEIEKLANKLKDLTNEFIFPEKACTTHKLLYRKLSAFYDNLMQHKYLETKLLFPKAICIEERLLQT
jgi:regulator of cell morphogenesis and NO signaling